MFRSSLARAYGTVQSPPSAGSLASRIPTALQEATAASAPRTNWTREEIHQIYHTPLNQLSYAAVGSDPNESQSRSGPGRERVRRLTRSRRLRCIVDSMIHRRFRCAR